MFLATISEINLTYVKAKLPFQMFPAQLRVRITANCVERRANESRSAKGIYLALEGTRLYIVLMACPDLCFI